MKYAIFENCMYLGKPEKAFYRYCRRRVPKLYKYLLPYLLWDILFYFHIFSKRKYLEKRWSFLRFVKDNNKLIEGFSAKSRRKIYIHDPDITAVSEHPRQIVEAMTGCRVLSEEYDTESCCFKDYIKSAKMVKEEGYTAYGTLLSPIMKRAGTRIYTERSRQYRSKSDYITHIGLTYFCKVFFMLLFCIVWGIVSLYLGSYCYDSDGTLFWSYFKDAHKIVLNILPVFVLCIALYLITNRISAACFLSGGSTFVLSLVNYFKLQLRNDPVMFEDVYNISEASNISSRYTIEFTSDMFTLAAVLVIGALLIRLFGEFRIKVRYVRPLALVLVGAFSVHAFYAYYLDDFYWDSTSNEEVINIWAATDQYISRGFLYPFIHSVDEALDNPPEGYDAAQCEEILGKYTYEDIPEDEKVNIIGIMLEAYADFSRFESVEMTNNVYEYLDELRDESYSGYLLTDIFAGGTVTTERNFLTGFTKLPSFRRATNSYVRYFSEQGYTAEGSHPSHGWFYNRTNVNEYLGFENYYFEEDTYYELSGSHAADNKYLLPNILKLYNEAVGRGEHYFSFNVTYQCHGPYSDSYQFFEEEYAANNGYPMSDYFIINNYLQAIKETNNELEKLVDGLRESEEPVVLVLFGDHMPWMGNNNSVYDTLGININLSNEEGFRNYYETPYIIWGNDAARDIFGDVFRGDGGEIGPYYLMSRMFDLFGWNGNSFMQYMREAEKTLPVIHTTGRYTVGDYSVSYDDLDNKTKKLADEVNNIQYYWRHNFVSGGR